MSSRTRCAASVLISSAFAIPSRLLSLVPSFSAYAETIGTNEIPVKQKSLLETVHRLVVETEVVAHLVGHHVPDELRHLLRAVAILLDRPLVDVDGVGQDVAIGGIPAGDVDPPVKPIEGIGRLDAHLLQGLV